MEISEPIITKKDGDIICEFPVSYEEKKLESNLRFRIDSGHNDLLSERCDAALVSLLIPAMAEGEDIKIKGTISTRLFYTLSRQYQAVLCTVIPSLEQINIDATTIRPSKKTGSGVATGFSAGVDSFSVLADHYYSETPEGFEVTHLLFNNVGSHGSGGEQLFRERYELISSISKRTGLPIVTVNSNMDIFYENTGFQRTHTPRNCAIPLLLQDGFHRFYYASAYSYPDISVEKSHAVAHVDPVIIPLLSTAGIDLLSVGSEYTRVEKTIQISEIDDSHDLLNVCIKPGSAVNCSDCWKCRRTLLTLEISDRLERYSDVFDLEVYYQRREPYMGKVLVSEDPYSREIVEFAKDRGFNFPVKSKFYAYTTEGLKKQMRKINYKVRQNSTLSDFIKKNPYLREVAQKWVQITS